MLKEILRDVETIISILNEAKITDDSMTELSKELEKIQLDVEHTEKPVDALQIRSTMKIFFQKLETFILWYRVKVAEMISEVEETKPTPDTGPKIEDLKKLLASLELFLSHRNLQIANPAGAIIGTGFSPIINTIIQVTGGVVGGVINTLFSDGTDQDTTEGIFDMSESISTLKQITEETIVKKDVIFCHSCGSQVSVEALFCTHCGTKLKDVSEEIFVDPDTADSDRYDRDSEEKKHFQDLEISDGFDSQYREEIAIERNYDGISFTHEREDEMVMHHSRRDEIQLEQREMDRFERFPISDEENERQTIQQKMMKEMISQRIQKEIDYQIQEYTKYDIHREVRIVAPQVVLVEKIFSVQVHFAKKKSDLPIPSPKQQSVDTPISFVSAEKRPELQVFLRTGDFKISSSSSQNLVLGFREKDRVKFNLKLSSEFSDLEQGDIEIDIIYKDTLLYSCDITIPIGQSTIEYEQKDIQPLRNTHQIDDEYTQIKMLLSEYQVEAMSLPYILQLAYNEILQRESIFEKASSIQHAFENFLLYHLSLAMGDETEFPWDNQKGRITLGLQRNYFERILSAKKWKKKVLRKIPYLKHYTKPLFKQLISDLIMYRNRFWAHNHRTPTQEQCEMLFESYSKKLQVLFFAMKDTFPHYLLIVDSESQVSSIPSSRAFEDVETTLVSGVYLHMGQLKPIKTMLSMERCETCDRNHLFYKMGVLEEKRPVLGVCHS
jgi:hypothetical protein